MSKRNTFAIESMDQILAANDDCIHKIKHINDTHFQMTGNRRRAFIKTYGCQMNAHDSEKLDAMLMDMGYLQAQHMEEADVILFNTCCVRENAELKVFGNLGHVKKLKEKRPDIILAVSGCMMQQPHVVEEIRRRYRYVDIVFGTHNLVNFPSLLEEALSSEAQVIEVWDKETEIVEGLHVNRQRTLKGFVNIMYGCNNFCTFCIVPHTRGRERSRKPEDIIAEIEALVAAGTLEVMLLGQNVNAYGKTLETPMSFADLLRQVDAIKGIRRIRFMTSHPKDISEALLVAMSECEHVCAHLHLPVQSGSNAVLKRMNRHYTRERYLQVIDRARALMPDIGLSTDIILGFPGETEAEFMETVDLIRRVGYDSAFTFLYSIRTGTPAATFDAQVSEAEKHRRIEYLLEVLNPMIHARMAEQKDKVLTVLVEGRARSEGAVPMLMGRTEQHMTVTFEGEPSLIGQFVDVRITEPRKFSLHGVRFEEGEVI